MQNLRNSECSGCSIEDCDPHEDLDIPQEPWPPSLLNSGSASPLSMPTMDGQIPPKDLEDPSASLIEGMFSWFPLCMYTEKGFFLNYKISRVISQY